MQQDVQEELADENIVSLMSRYKVHEASWSFKCDKWACIERLKLDDRSYEGHVKLQHLLFMACKHL